MHKYVKEKHLRFAYIWIINIPEWNFAIKISESNDWRLTIFPHVNDILPPCNTCGEGDIVTPEHHPIFILASKDHPVSAPTIQGV